MSHDFAEMLPVATSAVEEASDYIRAHRPATVTAKGDRDMVTDVDHAVEAMIRQRLAEATPGIDFLGEENSPSGATVDPGWMLDPIDGTANYVRGLDLCGISLALVAGTEPVVAVIDLPMLDQRYTAVQGSGAFAGDARLHVSGISRLDEAIVAVGDSATHLVAPVAAQVQRVRMLGSAALDLALLAAGVIDASISLDTDVWDTAAGVLVAREAGAHIRDIHGNPWTPESRMLVASCPALLDDVLKLATP